MLKNLNETPFLTRQLETNFEKKKNALCLFPGCCKYFHFRLFEWTFLEMFTEQAGRTEQGIWMPCNWNNGLLDCMWTKTLFSVWMFRLQRLRQSDSPSRPGQTDPLLKGAAPPKKKPFRLSVRDFCEFFLQVPWHFCVTQMEMKCNAEKFM